MRTALFGGTFNPIHTGHLLVAEAAREHFRLDRVVYLPTGQPPHKPDPAAPARHRLQMVRLAVRGNPFFEVSDWEIRQNRIVYSYEAIAHFAAASHREKIFFVIGSDSLRQLGSWRHGEALLEEATFLVVERPGSPWAALPSALRRRSKRVPSVPVPFASHELRRRVRDRLSIRYQVPAAVEAYIHKHRLYRAHE